MKPGILFCSAGRRVRLLNNARESIGDSCSIYATNFDATAPALYAADQGFVVPGVVDNGYINCITGLCARYNIKAVTTLIDIETEVLSANRNTFAQRDILLLTPKDEYTAHVCFDKYEMFKHASHSGIPTIKTYCSLQDCKEALQQGEFCFPLFIKPRYGQGSVGAHRVDNIEQLEKEWYLGEYEYIIQEMMPYGDCNADVYIDTVSNKVVSAFCKRKIETRIGGANKTISFKDNRLFAQIEQIAAGLNFCGPVDMDFFEKDGRYYLSEINPRFGGAYLHAYASGVDFFKMILNNINGVENRVTLGNYDDDIVMMMYDDVIVRRKSEMIDENFDIL